MATVVQARCPGCTATLWIPAEWIGQAIRCKECGTVIQSRQKSGKKRPSPPPLPTPAPSVATPLPPTKAASPPPPPIPTPPAHPTPASRPAGANGIQPAPLAAPIAHPVASPVGVSTAPPVASSPGVAPANAFSSLEASEDGSPSRRRKRRGRRSNWKGPVIALSVVVISVIASAILWTQLSPILFEPVPPRNAQAQKGPGPKGVGSRKGTSGNKPTSNPGKANPENGGKNPEPGSGGSEPPPVDPDRLQFPRRALIISVHNYLYANPIQSGVGGDRTMALLPRALNQGLRIPMTQIAHLSDEAPKGQARPPLKSVIERTLTDFLASSRQQDHILVFFVGHSAEIEEEAYLVPVEGELDRAETLIPLKWVYQQLADCKARQKVLVLDVNRFNPTVGQERPDSGPMSEMFAQAVQNPPPGVQVWSACGMEQRSYATDLEPVGLFLGRLSAILTPYRDRGETGLEGKIQRPDEPMPLAQINDLLNQNIEREARKQNWTQQAGLYGSFQDNGVKFDPSAKMPSSPTLAEANVRGGRQAVKLLEEVRAEISTPPVKPSSNAYASNFDILPPFDPEKLKKYEDGGEPDTKLKKTIARARVILWAVSTSGAPKDLEEEVNKIRQEVQVDLSVMREGYRAPAAGNAETQFKDRVKKDEEQVSEVMLYLQEALDELEGVEEDRDKATLRWQANYDFIHARLQAQIAYLYEYQSMLGSMRKEFPPRDPAIHSGWRLASAVDLQGDRTGRRLAKRAERTLEDMVEEHRDTPWEVLAKRQKLTALGLEWRPSAR